jgi:hypothetical protein
MSLIEEAWELQHRIEHKTQVFVKKMGKRFIVGLFAFSVLFYSIVEFVYYFFFTDYGTGADRFSGFIIKIDTLSPFFNPIIHLFCSIIVLFIIIKVGRNPKVGKS